MACAINSGSRGQGLSPDLGSVAVTNSGAVLKGGKEEICSRDMKQGNLF